MLGRAALGAVVALVGAVALYASALGLLAWAEDLDNTARVRAYSAKLGGCPIEFDRWTGEGRERCGR